MARRLISVLALLVSTGYGLAAEVTFTQQPTATRSGQNVRISFAVSAATDVQVAVVDAKGEIVRHLAAGLLGPNAPAPLRKDSLVQQLLWDRTDDDGQPVAGPVRVQVAAGLKPVYGGTAFTEESGPNNLAEVIGLAVGPGGKCYVMTNRWHSGWWTATTVHVFNRDGGYERTIKPFPADTPVAKLKGVGALATPDGKLLPIIHRIIAMSFYPYEDTAQQMAVTPDGNLHMVVIPAAYLKPPWQWLASISGRDGSLPYDEYAGERLLPHGATGDLYLAPGSDGKAVYITGLCPPNTGINLNKSNPPVVWAVTLPDRGEAKPFFGTPDKLGKDDAHLDDPRGLAGDGAGRLLIADRGNDRVLVVDEKTAKAVGSIAVNAPTWVGVHRASGGVYVRSGDEVIKFASVANPTEQGRMKLPPAADRARTRFRLAVDGEADPAVLWIGRNSGGSLLVRCTEKDGRFSPAQSAGFHEARRLWNLAPGQDGRTVACKVGWQTLRVLDERTGKTRDLRLTGSGGQTYRLGPAGQIYGMDHAGGGIRRWDADGKYLPFPATAGEAKLRGQLPSQASGTTSWERDFCVDRAGNVYLKQRGKFYHGRMKVDVYDPQGKFLRTVLWAVSDGGLGPRVDRDGNIYVADSVKPLDKPYPDEFLNRLPETGGVYREYTWMYGSVMKFGPKGGAIWFPVREPKVDLYAFDGEAKLEPGLPTEQVATLSSGRIVKPTELVGALWRRFGCSYVLDMHVSHNQRCHCTATEIDLDRFGRLFYPDQGNFRVVVLDSAGNELATFGQYGNQDDGGAQSRKDAIGDPARDLSIAWMVGLGATDRNAYVADALNRRVLVVRLDHAATAECEIPQ